MNEDEISFNRLPYDICRRIHEKLNYEQFKTFEECSRISRMFCEHRSSLTFPFTAEFLIIAYGNVRMVEKDKVNNKTVHYTNDARQLFSWKNPPAVRFYTDMLIIFDSLNSEMCSFIKERFHGITRLMMDDIAADNFGILSQYYFEIRKLFKLDSLSLIIGEVGNRCPRDFDNIYMVCLYQTELLTPETCFAMKCRQELRFRDSSIDANQLISQIRSWIDGQQWGSPCIRFDRSLNFDYDDFEKKLTQQFRLIGDIDPLIRSWVLDRKPPKSKSYAYSKLVISINEESINLNQEQPIYYFS